MTQRHTHVMMSPLQGGRLMIWKLHLKTLNMTVQSPHCQQVLPCHPATWGCPVYRLKRSRLPTSMPSHTLLQQVYNMAMGQQGLNISRRLKNQTQRAHTTHLLTVRSGSWQRCWWWVAWVSQTLTDCWSFLWSVLMPSQHTTSMLTLYTRCTTRHTLHSRTSGGYYRRLMPFHPAVPHSIVRLLQLMVTSLMLMATQWPRSWNSSIMTQWSACRSF